MDTKKFVSVLIIFVILMITVTAVIAKIKPQMHKSVMFEQIIFKRSK